MKILVTGAAGFIGFHLIKKLMMYDHTVVGIDNINDYYDVNLKYDRLSQLGICKKNIKTYTKVKSEKYPGFSFIKLDIVEQEKIFKLFEQENFELVIHLAAQTGVRYSIENPLIYIQSNIFGFLNILEACKLYSVKRIIYASSSSVYGNNTKLPFSEKDVVDQPVSIYAASKKSNELMAYTYSHLHNITTIGLRFFTVYGPWGRPDMAYYKFSEAILKKQPINVFNNGNLERDFTYIDDIIDGIINLLSINIKDTYKILNIGNNKPVKLLDFIGVLEKTLQKKAILNFLPMQKGDMYKTYADISSLQNLTGYKPKTSIEQGLKQFAKWFVNYKKL